MRFSNLGAQTQYALAYAPVDLISKLDYDGTVATWQKLDLQIRAPIADLPRPEDRFVLARKSMNQLIRQEGLSYYRLNVGTI